MLSACGGSSRPDLDQFPITGGKTFIIQNEKTGEQRTFSVGSENENVYAAEDLNMDASNYNDLVTRQDTIQVNHPIGESYTVMDITGLLFEIEPLGDNKFTIKDLGGIWKLKGPTN